MDEHSGTIRRLSVLGVVLLAAGAIACGRTPAGAPGAGQATAFPNAEITEFEYAGQRAAPAAAPGSGGGSWSENGGTTDAPFLVP